MPQPIDYCKYVPTYMTTKETCGPFRPIDENHKMGIFPNIACLKGDPYWKQLKSLGYSLVLVGPNDLSAANAGGWENRDILFDCQDVLTHFCDSLPPKSDPKNFSDDYIQIIKALKNGDFYGIHIDEPTTRRGVKDCWDAHGKEFLSIFHGKSSQYPMQPQKVFVDLFRDFAKLAPIVEGIMVDDWGWKSNVSGLSIAPGWFDAFAESFDGKGSKYPVSISGWLNIANNYMLNDKGNIAVEDQYDHLSQMLKSAIPFFDMAQRAGNGTPTIWVYPGDICMELLLKVLSHLENLPHSFQWFFQMRPEPNSDIWNLGSYSTMLDVFTNNPVKVKSDLSDLEQPLQEFLRKATKQDLLDFFTACHKNFYTHPELCGNGGQCSNGGVAQELLCWLTCNRMLEVAKKAAMAGWLRQDCWIAVTQHQEKYCCNKKPYDQVNCPWNDAPPYPIGPNWSDEGEGSSYTASLRPNNNLPDPVYGPPVEPCRYSLKTGPNVPIKVSPPQIIQAISGSPFDRKTIDGDVMDNFIKRGFIFDK
jgi:hypothetical protein